MLIKLVYHNHINTAHSDLLKFYENISNASLQQPSAAHSFMTYTTVWLVVLLLFHTDSKQKFESVSWVVFQTK